MSCITLSTRVFQSDCARKVTIVSSQPITAIFDSTTLQGMALYVPSDGHVELGLADADATSRIIGLANENVTASSSGGYVTEGQITKSDWTTVVGTMLLVPGAYYYLSETSAGQLTTTAPTSDGEYVMAVARGLTTQMLDIEIDQPITL